MSRLGSSVVFPPRYASTPAGLVAAQGHLDQLTEVHAAYAGQPNVSTIWQGYIDDRAHAVATQQAIVESLRRAVHDRFQQLGAYAAAHL